MENKGVCFWSSYSSAYNRRTFQSEQEDEDGISAETVNYWCRNFNTITNLGIGNLTWVPKRQKTLGADKSADVGTHRRKY